MLRTSDARPRRGALAAGVFTLLLLVLAGCGADEDASDRPGPSDTDVSDDEPTAPPTPEPEVASDDRETNQDAPPEAPTQAPTAVPDPKTEGPADDEALFLAWQGAHESHSGETAFSSVAEALPNIRFSDEVNGIYSVSDIAVVGSVESVELVAKYELTLDEPGEVEVDLSASVGAGWAAYEAVIAVDEHLGTNSTDTETPAVVGILIVAPPNMPAKDVQAALMRVDQVLVVGRQDNVLPARPDLYSVIAKGGYWFEVGEAGSLSAPGLPEEEAAEAVSGLTLDSLRQTGERGEVVIERKRG